MATLNTIVNLTITRQTRAVSKAGFGTAMVLGIHKRFTERIKYYSTSNAMLIVNGGDFDSVDSEYIAALPMFGQENAVTRVAVGRRKTSDTTVITITTVANNTAYTTTINGTAFEYTSDADATNLEIALGLVTAINLGAEPVTALDNVDGTYDLDADVADAPYTVVVDSGQTVTPYVASDTMANDLAAIKTENNDWYGLLLTSRTLADQTAAAAWVQTNKKFAGFGSADVNIINTTDAGDTTTLAAVLKAASYTRSYAFYSGSAATQYPESALFGVILPKNPGSYTTMFKTLAGITVDDLTDTQITNATDKYCMIYTTIGGVNMTQEGQTADSEYIDVIIFIDWLEAEIVANVFGDFVNQDKVPYTDAGAGAIEGDVKAALKLGVEREGLAEDPPYTTSVPLVADVSTSDKANRLLPDVEFGATLSGAIHFTNIAGQVTV
ncbi:DUF3383 family protein [Candidatus Pacearchaeota archaeon]|nr:DUF3383 family protein [Candidatus Pacearchaeota archaeon]